MIDFWNAVYLQLWLTRDTASERLTGQGGRSNGEKDGKESRHASAHFKLYKKDRLDEAYSTANFKTLLKNVFFYDFLSLLYYRALKLRWCRFSLPTRQIIPPLVIYFIVLQC